MEPPIQPSSEQAWEPPVVPSSDDGAQRGARPGVVTVSAVTLMVLGVMLALFGLVFTLFGAMFGTLRLQPELIDQLGPLPESFGIFILGFGLAILIWGVLQVVAAAFVLRRRSWARITAIVLAILGTLAGLALSLPGQGGINPVGLTFTLAFTGGHAFAIWALGRSGTWFSGA
jgi:hypothetical protein